MISKNIQNFIVDKDITILECLKYINDNHKRLVFVTEGHAEKIIGIVSDGDIRRALLRDISIYSSINKIMTINFIFSTIEDEIKLEELAGKSGIDIIPILDKYGKLKSIYFR